MNSTDCEECGGDGFYDIQDRDGSIRKVVCEMCHNEDDPEEEDRWGRN